MAYELLTNPYLVALGIPLILLCSGALGKKIVRRSGWERRDFYLGTQFTLAAMSSAFVYILDLVKQLGNPSAAVSASERLGATTAFVAITFFLFLTVLSVHQDWEAREDRPKAQFFWLGIVSNIIGGGLITSFILLVKGIQK